jgi:outer membrane murein-binding lipoprotein Lpp
MPRKEQPAFSVNINPFDGDPSYLKFFFVLLQESAKINSWTNEQTILCLKSKLTGAALKYLLETPELMVTNDIELIQSSFQNFFGQKSTNSAFTEFNNLIILPDESVKHFAHRLNVTTRDAYPDISDQNALNSIKLNKLLSSLPTNLRIKLREENIRDFQKATTRAQELQDIILNELLPNNSSAQCINTISANLANLTSKVDSLAQNHTQTHKQNNQAHSYSNNNFNNRNSFKTKNFRSRNNFSNFKNRNNQSIVCQLCFKPGHKALTCFKYVNRQRREQRQHPDYYRPRGSNFNQRQMHPQEDLN